MTALMLPFPADSLTWSENSECTMTCNWFLTPETTWQFIFHSIFLIKFDFLEVVVKTLFIAFVAFIDLQGGPCRAGRRLGPGLCGRRDPVRSQHDVSGTPLPPRQHLQPELLSRLVVLQDLLPPRGQIFVSCRR